MQNRVVPGEDGKGMGEWLREMDSNNKTMRVTATYFVQIFSQNKKASLQRIAQHKQNNPAQYFYSFNLTKVSKPIGQTIKHHPREAGIDDSVVLSTYPQSKNKIILRFDNIADKYDQNSKSAFVNVEAVANAIWNQANIK